MPCPLTWSAMPGQSVKAQGQAAGCPSRGWTAPTDISDLRGEKAKPGVRQG